MWLESHVWGRTRRTFQGEGPTRTKGLERQSTWCVLRTGWKASVTAAQWLTGREMCDEPEDVAGWVHEGTHAKLEGQFNSKGRGKATGGVWGREWQVEGASTKMGLAVGRRTHWGVRDQLCSSRWHASSCPCCRHWADWGTRQPLAFWHFTADRTLSVSNVVFESFDFTDGRRQKWRTHRVLQLSLWLKKVKTQLPSVITFFS